MSPEYASMIEDCVQRLRHGQTIEDCLAAYPQQAEGLRPLLQTALRVRTFPVAQPRPQAIQAGRERMLSEAQKKINPRRPVSFEAISRYTVQIFTNFKILLLGKENKGMKLALRLAIDLVVIFLISSFFGLNASASSLPGDPLYGVKRTWEDVRLGVTLDSHARQSLEAQFALERQKEIQNMIAQGREGTLDIEGLLEAVDSDTWIVGGLAILVEPQTVLEGNFGLGTRVTVQAQVRADGQVVALHIRFHDPLPDSSQTPEPTHTPEATHTSTPPSSMTPMPTHTSEPTHTPEATHTTMPPSSMTPMPTHTPEPSHTPEATHTWEPTHEPTHTDEPMMEPSHTSEPMDDDDDHGSEEHP